MTVAIIGAGAIGGLLAAHLARAGEDVLVIARGATLQALRANGLTIRDGAEQFNVRPKVTDEFAAIGSADVVFIAVKAHAIPGMAPAIGASLKSTAAVIGAMNGIPWWYFEDHHLESVDPGGIIARNIPHGQVVGAVVYPAASVVAPGVIQDEDGDRVSVGEPDGSKSERVQAISRMLTAAGFKAPVQARLRSEIWLKLLGNATLNPLSAITRATMGQIFATDDRKQLVRSLMNEVATVAHAYDIELPLSIERRMDGAAAMTTHKTSMLQDLEAGKPLETDALLGAVIELAGPKNVEVPLLRQLYVLTKLSEAVVLGGD
jgi:2-dehydropantoate 2-reductase